MVNFNEDSLANLENLCKIKLKNDEKKKFLEKLNQTIEYINQLKEVDTKSVEDQNFIFKKENVFREDIEEVILSRDEMLKNAPEKVAGMIKVPEIISKN